MIRDPSLRKGTHRNAHCGNYSHDAPKAVERGVFLPHFAHKGVGFRVIIVSLTRGKG